MVGLVKLRCSASGCNERLLWAAPAETFVPRLRNAALAFRGSWAPTGHAAMQRRHGSLSLAGQGKAGPEPNFEAAPRCPAAFTRPDIRCTAQHFTRRLAALRTFLPFAATARSVLRLREDLPKGGERTVAAQRMEVSNAGQSGHPSTARFTAANSATLSSCPSLKLATVTGSSRSGK